MLKVYDEKDTMRNYNMKMQIIAVCILVILLSYASAFDSELKVPKATGNNDPDPLIDVYDSKVYKAFMKENHDRVEEYLDSRKDVHPIVRKCFGKFLHSEAAWFDMIDWFTFSTKEGVQWYQLESSEVKALLNKHKYIVDWGNCLQISLQEQWKNKKIL